MRLIQNENRRHAATIFTTALLDSHETKKEEA